MCVSKGITKISGNKHRFSLSIGNGRYILLQHYRAHRFSLNPVLQPIVVFAKYITALESSTEIDKERRVDIFRTIPERAIYLRPKQKKKFSSVARRHAHVLTNYFHLGPLNPSVIGRAACGHLTLVSPSELPGHVHQCYVVRVRFGDL